MCINTAGSGTCGTLAKICNNRATCPVALSGPGACGVKSKCTSAAANVKTAPLATASHAMVLEYADAPRDLCATEGFRDLYGKVTADYEKDARAHLVKDLGRTKAAKITTVKFVPQICSPITNAGKPTGRHGIGGYVTVTGPPDLVDDVLQALDRDDMPYPASTKTVCGAGCRRTAAKLPVSYGGAAASAVAGDEVAGAPASTSELIDFLLLYIGNSFDARKFDAYGNSVEGVDASINPSSWFKSAKIYAVDTFVASCAATGTCFAQTVGACNAPLSTQYIVSSAQRQQVVAANALVGGNYVGITGSGSSSFTSAQNTLEESDAVLTMSSAECSVHFFIAPYGNLGIGYSPSFVADLGAILDAIGKASVMADPTQAANLLGRALRTLHDKYGTHIPFMMNYIGLMRLQFFVGTEALVANFNDEGTLAAAISHAAADLQGSARSPETTILLQSSNPYAFVRVPGAMSVPVVPSEWNKTSVNVCAVNIAYAPAPRLTRRPPPPPKPTSFSHYRRGRPYLHDRRGRVEQASLDRR